MSAIYACMVYYPQTAHENNINIFLLLKENAATYITKEKEVKSIVHMRKLLLNYIIKEALS